MRFLRLTYAYSKGHPARTVVNLAALLRFDLFTQETGHSRIILEWLSGTFDHIMFANRNLAATGFEDLIRAIRTSEQTGVYLITGFSEAPPAALPQPDGDDSDLDEDGDD